MVSLRSKEGADLVEKMAVPVQSDRGGMISCTEALGRRGDEAFAWQSKDCHLESCTLTLQSGSSTWRAGCWQQPHEQEEGELSPSLTQLRC